MDDFFLIFPVPYSISKGKALPYLSMEHCNIKKQNRYLQHNEYLSKWVSENRISNSYVSDLCGDLKYVFKRQRNRNKSFFYKAITFSIIWPIVNSLFIFTYPLIEYRILWEAELCKVCDYSHN